MSDFVPSNVRTNHNITQWTNDAADAINRGKTVHSQDFTINKTAGGTKISLKRRHKYGYEDPYQGEYDASAHFAVGDIVRVLPDRFYADANGDQVKAMVGVWKCVANVPDENVSNV